MGSINVKLNAQETENVQTLLSQERQKDPRACISSIIRRLLREAITTPPPRRPGAPIRPTPASEDTPLQRALSKVEMFGEDFNPMLLPTDERAAWAEHSKPKHNEALARLKALTPTK